MSSRDTSQASTDTLAKLVRQKRTVLEQLSAVAQRQAALIEANEMAQLIRLLSAKQQLVTALHEVEKQLAPFRNDDPDRRVWASTDARAACAADSQECTKLLEKVLQMEREQENQMVGRRDTIAAQLQKAQSAHQVASAYQPYQGNARQGASDTPAPLGAATAPGALDLTTNG